MAKEGTDEYLSEAAFPRRPLLQLHKTPHPEKSNAWIIDDLRFFHVTKGTIL